MCRLLGWNGLRTPLSGPILDAPHALLRQSRASREAPVTRHGDGHGLAWYRRGGAPERLRGAAPAWRAGRFAAVCRRTSSRLALAHVRAATDGDAAPENSHPFVDGRLAFVHVGQIAGMDAIRGPLLDAISPERRAGILGDTDSELLFALLVERGLERDPVGAYDEALHLIAERQREAGTERSVRLSALHADGRSLFAFRHATDGDPPPLYRSGAFLPGAVTIASEPLDARRTGWRVLPIGRLFRVGPRVGGGVGAPAGAGFRAR